MSPFIEIKDGFIDLRDVISRAEALSAKTQADEELQSLTFMQALNEIAKEFGEDGVALPKTAAVYKEKTEVSQRMKLYFELVISNAGHGDLTDVLVKAAIGNDGAQGLLTWYSDMIDAQKAENVKSENLYTWMQARALPV